MWDINKIVFSSFTAKYKFYM